MTFLQTALANNALFADTEAKDHVPSIPFIPNGQLYVMTCIDPRVDPHPLMGLSLGDAIVARNVGGRVNQALLEDLAWITYLHETKTPATEWFQIALIHHTDCGSGLMADDESRAGFVERGHDEATLLDTAVVDPYSTVRVDVQKLRESSVVPNHVVVSGYVYDVATGLLTEADAPRATRIE